MVTIEQLRSEAEIVMEGVSDGNGLDPLGRALIDLAVKASVTSLDQDALDKAMALAFDAGASAIQIQEILSLVSGLGVHSLMVSASHLIRLAAARGESAFEGPLDVERQALWDRYIGDDPYWTAFEQDVPGFLDALLRLSPAQFRGFHDYCAIPWTTGSVRAIVKELAALATDATPTHRYRPGFRMHLRNAIKLGAGRRAVSETLDIAAAAPLHVGTA